MRSPLLRFFQGLGELHLAAWADRAAVSTRIGSLNNLPATICPGSGIIVILEFGEGSPSLFLQTEYRILLKILPQSEGDVTRTLMTVMTGIGQACFLT